VSRAGGALFFDHVYFQHGSEWKEYRWYKDIQVSWNIFCNEYDDGTTEFGQIVRGSHGWGAGGVVHDDHAASLCTDVAGDFTLDEEGYVVSADYDLGRDGVWSFTAAKDQQAGRVQRCPVGRLPGAGRLDAAPGRRAQGREGLGVAGVLRGPHQVRGPRQRMSRPRAAY